MQRCALRGPLERRLYARFSRSRDLPRAKKRSEHRWIVRRDGCCHLPRACSVVVERCRDANGRVVYFYLDFKTSSSHRVSALRMPYHSWESWTCDEIKQGDMGWTTQCSVACCQEGEGHRLRCNQDDDDLRPGKEEFQGRKPAAKKSASRTLLAVTKEPELVNCP